MRHGSVFDWAQVKLAEECLSVLFKVDAPKQHVVTQLANVGGVTVTWDGTGMVKLEGSWEHILKSQTVFENYLKSLEDSDITDHGKKIELDPEFASVAIDDVKQNSSSKCTPVDNPVTEGNEVYVNITLSSMELSDLDPKSIQVVNSTHEDNTIPNVRTQPGNSHIINCKKNMFEQNFLTKTETNCSRINSVADTKVKESVYDVSEYQSEVLYNICDSQKSDRMQETMCQSSNFNQDQFIPDDSKIHHSVDEVTCSKNIQLEKTQTSNPNRSEYFNIKCSGNEYSKRNCIVDDSCTIPKSAQTKQKYHKKKDYEELAPFKFFCSLCSFKSKRESHYTRHMKLHSEVSELFKCNQCNFTSIRLSHLRRHELNHSNLTLTCNTCQYHTNSQKLLVRHKRIKHSATKVSEARTDILHCVHCEYQTNRHHFLQRHMKVHITDVSSIQVYQCEQCSYKTNRKEHFVRHTNNIHKGQRPFLCHRCGKAFKRQDALKQHSSTHATQAAVTCPECGKGCRSQAHLSQHMSVHSSDRAFLCELCGASFKTRAVQRKHMFTIHQHPKAFLCGHCSRKFSTKFALRRHVKQHSSQISAEKKPKHQDQQASVPVFIPDTSSMRLVAMDTVFFSEPARSHPEQNTTTHNPREGEKITLQLAETYETETVRVIPAQTVMHPNSETTALVYLTGTFAPL